MLRLRLHRDSAAHQPALNLTSLSQHFLFFTSDVEQKFSALESSIHINCTNPDNLNAELLALVKYIIEVVPNLGCIADDFGCSNGLGLILTRGHYRIPCPSRSGRFPEFGAQSAVGLCTAQRTATSTEQCPWCPTTTRCALYLILASP
jgi:hypothetical protein